MSETQSNGVPETVVLSQPKGPPEVKPMGEAEPVRQVTEEQAKGLKLGKRVLSPSVSAKLREVFKNKAQVEEPAPEKGPDTVPDAAPIQAPPATPAPEPSKEPELPAYLVDAAMRLADGQKALDRQRHEMKEGQGQIAKITGLKPKWGQNKIATMRELISLVHDGDPDQGLVDFADEYTRQVLGIEPSSESKALSATARVEQELREMKQKQAEAERQANEDKERQEADRLERENVSTIQATLEKRAADYPFVTAYGTIKPVPKMVYAEIVDEFKKSGQTISIEEAARRVESSLVTDLEPFRALLSPSSAAEKPKAKEPTSTRPKSLSSSVTSAPAPRTQPDKPLSPKEKRAQTLARVRELHRQNQS
jgi:hypothetical protein